MNILVENSSNRIIDAGAEYSLFPNRVEVVRDGGDWPTYMDQNNSTASVYEVSDFSYNQATDGGRYLYDPQTEQISENPQWSPPEDPR